MLCLGIDLIRLHPSTAGPSFKKRYSGDGVCLRKDVLTTTIGIPKDENFLLAIFNTAGSRIIQQSYSGKAPAVTLDVPLPLLPAGIYFMQITTTGGQRTTKQFPLLQ